MQSNNKKELIQQLESMRYAAYYNIFSQQALHEYIKLLFRTGKVPFELPGLDLIDGSELKLSSFLLKLEKSSKNHKIISVKRYANAFITRNWLKETFRLVQSYTKKHDLLSMMLKKDWYHFARIYVNAYSHNSIFIFTPRDKQVLPCSYKGVVIDESKDGCSASLRMHIAYELVEDIIDFVVRDLS